MATSLQPNQLAGMPLDYLLGAEGPQRGRPGRITETPFGEGPAANGASIAYCNLRREDGEPDEYGPYLSHDDIFEQYGEGRPDPRRKGFRRNLVEQLDSAKQLGHVLVEQDNPDSYDLAAVTLGLDLAQERGLAVVAKNPGMLKADAPAYVGHPAVVGIIVERDCGSPEEMDALRRKAGKPGLPVWFVTFGDGRPWASSAAGEITSRGFSNMSVTFDRAEAEYGGAVEDVLLPRIPDNSTNVVEHVVLPRIPIHSTNVVKPMPDAVPPWLATMKSITGTLETPGDAADNPVILSWRNEIARRYPDMASYCAGYTHDSVPWCGLTIAYVMAVNGIRPVFGPTDTDKFLWADAWRQFGKPCQPKLGCVMVFTRDGGGHVSLYEGEEGGNYVIRGGNQSDSVNVTHMSKSKLSGAFWPDVAAITQPIPLSLQHAAFPQLQQGSIGPDVIELQTLLGGVDVDGEFGPLTEAAVNAFKAAHGMVADGIVRADTWQALRSSRPAMASGRAGSPARAGSLTQDVIARIAALAGSSELARIAWSGRGTAPIGYIKGVAVTFARVYLKLKAGDSAALAMTAPIGGKSTDALAWYGLAGGDRPAILRQLFSLLYGLGMRESSGNCFEGRDQSASNVSSDTAEAGLFQQSWNSRSASPELPKLLAAYSANPEGFLSIFREGIHGSPTPNEGSGDGAAFQALCKSAPAFAVEAAAIGLRTIGGGPHGHWGPINRHDAEVRAEAEQLLQQVQGVVDSAPPVVVAGGRTIPTDHRPLPAAPLAEILKRLKGLENVMNGTAASGSSTTSTPPHIDLARIEQDIARLGQIAGTFSQFANTVGQIPTTGLPPQVAQVEQSITRLGQIAATLSQFATSLSGLSQSAGAPAQELSPIDKALGGQAMVGLKTPLAILGYVGMSIMQSFGAVGTMTGDKATTTGTVLTSLIGGFGALGVTSKFDRAFKAISVISGVLQKLPGLLPPKAGGGT